MRLAVCTARGYAVFRGIDLSARNGLTVYMNGRKLLATDTALTYRR
jgi:hypothetical protein